MAAYANIIVDISLEKLDKTFQYRIPKELEEQITEGVQVRIPFGKRTLTGYVMECTDTPEYDVTKIRPIIGIEKGSVAIESQLIALAGWMKRNYGSTMNQALKTVLPVKQKVKQIERKRLILLLNIEDAYRKLELFEQKHYTAKARLLGALIETREVDQQLVVQKLNISTSTIKSLEKDQIIRIDTDAQYRNPVSHLSKKEYTLSLNSAQQSVVDTVDSDMEQGISKTYLLK